MSPARVKLVVALALGTSVFVLFGQTADHPFSLLDDDHYVYQNPDVIGGVTLASVRWAFTQSHAANWHPLTWISHMLDCELFGLQPGGHHLMNVLIHALASISLFFALAELTGALWPSAFTAAVFAIHPAHVESVAWVAERKDVLSGLFFALALWAYGRYAAGPSLERYVLVAVLFGLGLLSKPMLVTFPFVLLLLDYWPLRRLGPGATARGRVVLEKVPLLALSIGSCIATVFAQDKGTAIISWNTVPVGSRIANALVSYVVYIRQTIYPADLSVFYPHPSLQERDQLWEAIAAGVVLLVVTVAVVRLRTTRSHLAVGWFWYLGMLVPVIGLVQVGSQARADRYLYLPQVGLCLALAWELTHWMPPLYLRWAGGAALVILAGLTINQVRCWKDDETLLRHSIAVTSFHNWVMDGYLGKACLQNNELEEAVRHLRSAYESSPTNRAAMFRSSLVSALIQRGVELVKKGRMEDACERLQEALKIDPNYPDLRQILARSLSAVGVAQVQRGDRESAIANFRRAIETDPRSVDGYYNLGRALTDAGSPQQAVPYLHRALELDPNNSRARRLLEQLAKKGAP